VSRKRGKSTVGSVVELVVIVATALGLALAIQAFIVKPYRIPSGSMLPTIHLGQRVLVNRLGDDFSSPSLGEIIVFHPPQNYDLGCVDQSEGQSGGSGQKPCGVARTEESGSTFIKRVVGLPGDRIAIVNGHVMRNGKPESDSYIAPCGGVPSCNFPVAITVPRGDYYMMGDNRGQSDDSRFWGPVPRSWIIGGAFFTYWPPDRIGTL
jgi:signal peptidase I